ncbi:MAG: hypothetical protein M3512_13420, partial [Bacteroidota bacterium]|nr:hypothetical protein [Bacteroidota bacterium]
MKKKLLIIGFIGITSLTMFSCKKDNPNPVAVTPSPVDPDPTTDPPTGVVKTPEQHKAILESNGTKLVEELEILKKSKGVVAVSSLAHFLNTGGGINMRNSSSGNLLKAIQNFRAGKGSTDGVYSAMRLSDHSSSLKEFFEEYSGTYAWNKATEEFDFVSGGTQIKLQFP